MRNKENINKVIDILLIISITLIFSMPMMADGIYFESTDGAFHLNRLIGIKEALLEHQIIPKIYPYTNNGYGYASPLFYCDFFLYPFAIIYYLSLPLIKAFKLMYIFYTLVGSIIAFYCFKKIFKQEKLYRTVAIVFLLGQYRFLDAYTRLAFGEYLALCFLPLLLYAFYKVLVLKEDSYLLLAFGFTTLVLTHNLTFGLYCFIYAVLIIIFIINNRNLIAIKNLLITSFKACIIAVLLSLWFLLPMLEGLMSHNLWISKLTTMYSLNELHIGTNLLLKPFMSLDIWTSNPIGYVLLILPFFIFFIKDSDKYLRYITIIGYVALLGSFNIIPFYLIKPFNGLQFAFRFNIIAYPFLAISASYVSYKLHNLLPYVIIIYTLVVSLQFDYQLLTVDRLDDYTSREVIYDFNHIKKDYNEREIVGAEYLPITLYNDYLRESTFIKRVNDDGKYEDVIYDFNRHFLKIDFTYDSDRQELLMMPLTYYKGYAGYALKDGNMIPLDIINIHNYEKVGFYTLDDNYEYHIYYKGTFIQHLSLVISVLTLLTIITASRKRHTSQIH